jgi:hypothetical protein
LLERGLIMTGVVKRASMPLSAKKTKNRFRESRSHDMSKVLTVEHCLPFSKQACEYMVAYIILDNNNSNSEEVVGGLVERGGWSNNEPKAKWHMTAYLVEKIMKQCKSHRSDADSDAGFINGIVDKMQVQQQS